MAHFNQPYSAWANAASHRPHLNRPAIADKKESYYFKLAILIGMAYLVWDKKVSITFAVAETNMGNQTEQLSLFGQFFKSKSNTKVISGEEQARYLDFADRFAPVAAAEMRKFGIPASISLAHAILISNAGASSIAQESCNPFHLTCSENSCTAEHCVQGTNKEKYLQFQTAWSGYRAFSKKVAGCETFQSLLNQNNITGWAIALKKEFKQDTKNYDEQLIELISQLQLRKYDQPSEEEN